MIGSSAAMALKTPPRGAFVVAGAFDGGSKRPST
jgi:hypothetical protein